MLHLITTTDDRMIEQCLAASRQGDHVVFVGIQPTTSNLVLIQKSSKNKDLNIMATKNDTATTKQKARQTELTIINYGKLVEICALHPTTHTWF